MDDGLFTNYSPEGRALIRKAYDLAESALAGKTRSDGSPFIGHPLAVAKIVSDEIGLPPECVAAVFLHEACTAGEGEVDIRSLKLDESVYKMVDGLNKISTIKPKDTRLEAENYKKLIIQYSTDPRVTVLKLADRLEVMRSLSIFPKSSRERKVLETLMLYIPLAHQLGLYNMKREMEDIYLSYAEPEQYRLITNKLKATEKDREKLMAEFIEPLKVKLSEAGIRYKLKIRTKAAYSIWCKMVKQKVPFEGVFDVFAIRFIIDCPEDIKLERELCWKVFGFVTEEYEQDTKRLRDWVTNPKTNGYESLHITVKNKEGAYVEVQIRTRRMDDIAENGFASHWSYKGIKREETMDKWLTSVRYALEHPDTDSPEELPQPPTKDIFVFTPTGELRILPAGATVLDFAFSIHTGIGQHCVGGKVHGKPVPIKEALHTGDVVEILTAKNQRPAPDWIGWVVTTKARQKIKQALSEGEQKLASAGRELLERRLKNWRLTFPDEMLTEMMKKRRMSSVNAFFAAVGDGTIDVNEIKEYILTEEQRHREAMEAAQAQEQAKSRRLETSSKDDILVLNAKDLKGLDYRMAKCCNPVFGDDVFGFVTRENGIKIHRITCPNASRLIETYPYRIQKVRWADTPSSGSFQVTLKITTDQESEALNKIMEVVGAFKASIRTFNVQENQRQGTYDIVMKILIPSNMELDKILSQIRAQKHVLKVNRV
ncbi:MAG: bifunctional (p)ppGpp synthetase/guanosine-3',5'-bis(diphosphate) 3'-pyrophosphohydrolase [Bacteroidales bacterium]|nr:bifunctional (p)ppGpp synthetase/guanosine-3',5'-bis(diphosphate) 3'-pyrophosphohydrolase [Bacteroidales bacterium]MBR1795602.1 bifunctional (p)ppGpp synthetase/guanosine-3',5'-bis(diphosphate) 3'-pyrophosphohydrolase [Bacteroidales bacterium]